VIRPIAIGKKNWLFAGSERAGYRAAAIQSLFVTAKLNGLDPACRLAENLDKSQLAPTVRSTRCYRSQTLHSPEFQWKVVRLDAYSVRRGHRFNLRP
jgi:hypothetical protein